MHSSERRPFIPNLPYHPPTPEPAALGWEVDHLCNRDKGCRKKTGGMCDRPVSN